MFNVLLFLQFTLIIRIGQRRIHLLYLINIRQYAGSEKQTAAVEGIEQGVIRVKTTDVHIALRMNETLISYINAYMDNFLRNFVRGFAPKKH